MKIRKLRKSKLASFFELEGFVVLVRIFGFAVFLVGMAFLLNSFFGITGFIVNENSNRTVVSGLGLALEIIGILLMFVKYDQD